MFQAYTPKNTLDSRDICAKILDVFTASLHRDFTGAAMNIPRHTFLKSKETLQSWNIDR